MRIPFTKAHGAQNDFLLTWTRDLTAPDLDLPQIARAICDRHTGVGADGWMLLDERPGIQLYNSDGSKAELSGNGTRCAAALLLKSSTARELTVFTEAGPKHLTLIDRHGLQFELEMNMGRPEILELRFDLPLRRGVRDVTILDCGNPQCAVPVADFEWDWQSEGAEIERHPHFSHRTNVSFLRPVDDHNVEVRFLERGAGVTQSSGTGSTGAACCALARGMVKSPVTILTPAGPLTIREDAGELLLTGPAVLIAEGFYDYDGDG